MRICDNILAFAKVGDVRRKNALTILGVGVGEGLAAVRGYQSGAEGAAVAMPTLSREIETV